MIDDENLLSTLRITHRNRSGFACRDAPAYDDISVESMTRIPLENAFYYVGGATVAKNGESFDSVFYLDTRGEIFAVYWLVKDAWYSQSEPELFDVLGIAREDIFPVQYELAIPLEYDGPLS